MAQIIPLLGGRLHNSPPKRGISSLTGFSKIFALIKLLIGHRNKIIHILRCNPRKYPNWGQNYPIHFGEGCACRDCSFTRGHRWGRYFVYEFDSAHNTVVIVQERDTDHRPRNKSQELVYARAKMQISKSLCIQPLLRNGNEGDSIIPRWSLLLSSYHPVELRWRHPVRWLLYQRLCACR